MTTERMSLRNKYVREYVQRMEKFRNRNKTMFSEWYEQGNVRRYIVYSYSYHWPMFIAEQNDDGSWTWYENVDICSKTTSRHQSLTHPLVDTIPMTLGAMHRIVCDGVVGLAVKGELSGIVASAQAMKEVMYSGINNLYEWEMK